MGWMDGWMQEVGVAAEKKGVKEGESSRECGAKPFSTNINSG